MCEKHFDGEKTNTFYENTGDDPAKFRNTEVGRIIDIGTGSSNVNEYMEIVSLLGNQEHADCLNGGQVITHIIKFQKVTVTEEHKEKETQNCCRSLFDNPVSKGTDPNVFSFNTFSFQQVATFSILKKCLFRSTCTEIKMKMSEIFQKQGNTFSQYKHYNSVKILGGSFSKRS